MNGVAYPVAWHLSQSRSTKPEHRGLRSTRQANATLVHYWEGAVVVSGSHSGVGYLELSGYVE